MKTEEEMVELLIQNANNFGKAADMYHPDYGWIIKDHKTTEAGIKFFKDHKEALDETRRKNSKNSSST